MQTTVRFPLVRTSSASTASINSGGNDLKYHARMRMLLEAQSRLEASARTSALLSGFAVIALVELQTPVNAPEWVIALYTVGTVVLVSIHLVALFISTCLRPHLEALISPHLQPTAEDLKKSPHVSMSFFVKLAWHLSTTIGIVLFFLMLIVVVWIKVYYAGYTLVAPVVATSVLIPVLALMFVFTHQLWRRVYRPQYRTTEEIMTEIDRLKSSINDQLEQA